MVDHPQYVARGRVARVDDVVGVQRGHLGAADREPLEPALVDQRARRARAAGVLEHGAAAGLIERRPGLAPAQQLALQLLQLGGRLLDQRELRLKHHQVLEVRAAVLVGDLLAGDRSCLPLGVHDRHLRDDLGELGAVRARVHHHAAAHGARNPDEPLDSGESCLGRAPRQDGDG